MNKKISAIKIKAGNWLRIDLTLLRCQLATRKVTSNTNTLLVLGESKIERKRHG